MSTISVTATPTSTAPSSTATSSGSPSDTQSSIGAAAYYGAIALAILVLFGVLVVSRCLYTRRARRLRRIERVELTRRGAQPGLPTYIETTAPTTLSYIANPLSSLLAPLSRPVPPSHPAYVPPNLRSPDAAYHPGDTAAPPAYANEPPKYEEAGEVAPVREGEEPPATTARASSSSERVAVPRGGDGMDEVDLERGDAAVTDEVETRRW